MASTISSNMNLIIPTVGTQSGPQYATDVNASLTLIDQHDHSQGRGVQITPAGLNINDTLSVQNNSVTDVEDLVFVTQSSSTTLQALYVAPGTESPAVNDLFFNDGNGNVVQITSGGIVNAIASSIPGQSYAAGTFFWKQGTGSTTPANFDIGSITLRPTVPLTTYGVVLSPPAAIISQYDIAFPLLPIGSSKILSMDTGGNMYALIDVDNVSLELVANVLAIKNLGVSTAKIANLAVTTAKIDDEAVTRAKLDPSILDIRVEEFENTIPSFAVRVATTVNGTFATAFDNGSTIDAVVLATNDIILIKNQTTTTEDGVYIVQASGAPVRHTDYDTFAELNGANVYVTLGTTNIGTYWFQNNILTSLSDPQSWSRNATYVWTAPPTVSQAIIIGCGGGGGGGGAFIVNSGGAGGGGAGLGVVPVDVTPGADYTITVGGGGTRGNIGNTGLIGDPGGTSSFSSLATFVGAFGGASNTTTLSPSGHSVILGGAGVARGGPGKLSSGPAYTDPQFLAQYNAGNSPGTTSTVAGGGGAGAFGNGANAKLVGDNADGNNAADGSGAGAGGAYGGGPAGKRGGIGGSGKIYVVYFE